MKNLLKSYGFYGGLVVLLFITIIFAVGTGPVPISMMRVVEIFGQGIAQLLGWSDPATQSVDWAVIWSIRLPRIVLAIMVGGSLAISGALLQGLFRNPLADPSLIGIVSGASLGAALALVGSGGLLIWLNELLGVYYVPTFSSISGFITILIVYSLSQKNIWSRETDVTTLLLAGLALSFFCEAFLGILIFQASETELRDLTFWRMGSLNRVSWTEIKVLLPLFIIGNTVLMSLHKTMNLLLLGEQEAQYLGIKVEKVKRIIIFTVALLVGSSVAVTGGIAFIGLVVPHLMRLLKGPDFKSLLPSSFLFGAILLLLADLGARNLYSPVEIPIGIITTLLGVPFFIYLLRSQKRKPYAGF